MHLRYNSNISCPVENGNKTYDALHFDTRTLYGWEEMRIQRWGFYWEYEETPRHRSSEIRSLKTGKSWISRLYGYMCCMPLGRMYHVQANMSRLPCFTHESSIFVSFNSNRAVCTRIQQKPGKRAAFAQHLVHNIGQNLAWNGKGRSENDERIKSHSRLSACFILYLMGRRHVIEKLPAQARVGV